MIDITGLNKVAVLAALYNHAKPLGKGILHYDPAPMTANEAALLLAQTTDFDYLKGRAMKVHLDGDSFDEWLYDRDNGAGAAERAVESARLQEYESLMQQGCYWEAAEAAGLQYCDICGRSEVDHIAKGDLDAGLIQMTRYEEWAGLVVCKDCPPPDGKSGK